MGRKFFYIILILLIGFTFSLAAPAKDKKDKTTIMKGKDVTGEISMIESTYISVIYKRDKDKGIEYEMMLPLNKEVIFTRTKLEDLSVGDEIIVSSDEHFVENDEGQQKFDKKVIKEIKFLRNFVKDKLIGREK